MSKFDVSVDAPLTWFEVVVPLQREFAIGGGESLDVTFRFPSADQHSAEDAAHAISWEIVSNLPKGPDNNRYGWKIASYGIAVQVAAP